MGEEVPGKEDNYGSSIHSSWGNCDQVVERPWHGTTFNTIKCEIYNVLQCSPALAEVRTGSVNTQASDASLLNQPSAFHEEPYLGLCSNIISGSLTLVTLLRKDVTPCGLPALRNAVLQMNILMSKKRFHTLQLPPRPLGSEGSLYHGEKPESRRLCQDLRLPTTTSIWELVRKFSMNQPQCQFWGYCHRFDIIWIFTSRPSG